MPLSKTNGPEFIDPVTLERAQRFSRLVSLKNELRRISAHKDRLETAIAELEVQVKQDIEETLNEK